MSIQFTSSNCSPLVPWSIINSVSKLHYEGCGMEQTMQTQALLSGMHRLRHINEDEYKKAEDHQCYTISQRKTSE